MGRTKGSTSPGASESREQLPQRLRLIEEEGPGFVGRDAELERLRELWSDVRRGELRMAALGGQPGIGKTRLAAHLAAEAQADGALVLYGRSEAELAIPVQAFAEAFGQFATGASGEQLDELGDAAVTLARIVPAIRDHLRDGDLSELRLEPGEHHELFHAGATLIRLAARERPLLLVVDDMHWADRPTALMLRYLLSLPDPVTMMIVATYRTTELDPDSTVAATLHDLERHPNAVNIGLDGLELDDSVRLAEELAGHPLDATARTLAEMAHEETHGNPLFLTQFLRSISEAGAIDQAAGRSSLRRRIESIDLPGTVSETIRRRIDQLGPEHAAVLASASVMGVEFDPGILRAVDEGGGARVDAALDAASRAGIVARAESGGPFSFTHPLIPRVLYDAIGEASRGGAHRRAALALEQLEAETGRGRASTLARHWLEALPADHERARQWACGRARRRSRSSRPKPRRAGWVTRWHSTGKLDDRDRCDLLIGLGVAQRMSGEPDFRETLLEAARLAAELGDASRLCEAALANNRGFASASGTVDAERIAILELALERIGEERQRATRALLCDARRRAQLLRRTGSAAWRSATKPLAIARRLGNPATLSSVLTARFVPIWIPRRSASASPTRRRTFGSPIASGARRAVRRGPLALGRAGAGGTQIEAASEAIERASANLPSGSAIRPRGGSRRTTKATWRSSSAASTRRSSVPTRRSRSPAPQASRTRSRSSGARWRTSATSRGGWGAAGAARPGRGRESRDSRHSAPCSPSPTSRRAARRGPQPARARARVRLRGDPPGRHLARRPHDLRARRGGAGGGASRRRSCTTASHRSAGHIVYTGISAWGDGDHALGRLATVLDRSTMRSATSRPLARACARSERRCGRSAAQSTARRYCCAAAGRATRRRPLIARRRRRRRRTPWGRAARESGGEPARPCAGAGRASRPRPGRPRACASAPGVPPSAAPPRPRAASTRRLGEADRPRLCSVARGTHGR